MSTRLSRRWSLTAAGAVILGAGLFVHFAVGGAAGGFVADGLYAALVFVLLAFLMPRVRVGVPAILALAFCVGIELWQLTPVPGELSWSIPGASLVLGSTFQWLDLVAYTAGVALAVAVDASVRWLSARRLASA
jgi:hypothetical protein